MLARLHIHWAELPSLDRVAHPLGEARLLLLVIHRKPVLDEVDARAHQHLLELRTGSQELLVLLVSTEAHDALDPGAVVPTPIKKDHLAACRQMRDITLEIPLPTLLLSGCAERDDAANAGVKARRDALDNTALTGCITTLENDDDLEAL